MHTKSGAVVVGQASAPGALAEWIQIFPIPKLTQQQWARDFLVKHALGSDSSVASAVLSERWYLDLPSRLREIDPSLFVAWNKERTQKTMEEVERWCKENRIPTDSVFYSPHPRVQSRSLELSTTTQIHTTRSVIVDPTIEAEVPTQGDAYLRGKLLQAISSMTTDELLELRVPLKYVASLFLGVEKGISTDPRSSD
jgi:hypothetical protein